MIALLNMPVMASEERASLRQWVHSRLTTEIAAPHPDLNLISSFSMPLVTDILTTSHPGSRKIVLRLSHLLKEWGRRQWQCGDLVDLHLVNGFLRRVNAGVDLSASDQQLRACNATEDLLDVANLLVFYCGFSHRHEQEFIHAGLRRLLKAQRQDGAFVRENGKPGYYLTSHALLALYFCDADRDVVNSSRERIQALLPVFLRQGFVDGVAETLIFLRWTGAPADGEREYLEWLRSLVASDGGVCYYYHPSCKPHWHTVSLMMQLLLEVTGDDIRSGCEQLPH